MRLAKHLLLLGGLSLGAFTGCGPAGDAKSTAAPVSEAARVVGAVDQEVLANLPEIKGAEASLKADVEKLQKQVEASLPKDGKFSEEDRKKIAEAQQKIQKMTNEKMNPLKTRLEACILSVSRSKKLLVVLDKRIVVYGVQDITDEVKQAFQSPESPKTGDEVDTSKSPIGYFDQEVVRSLKVFDSAQMKIIQKRAEMMRDYQKKEPQLSDSEKQIFQQRLSLELEAYREQMMAPLVQQVNDSVKEVAQKQGLSLVLDKQHVMQGGRNMTTDVVDTFLSKAGGGGKPAPKSSATPAPTVTP